MPQQVNRRALSIAAVVVMNGALLTQIGAAHAATPLCFGQPATIVGTDGPDNLIGQGGVADVIYAGGGSDYVLGGEFYGDEDSPGEEQDLICGGPGNDILTGSPGNDRLKGGYGDDRVDGANGADVERGNAGNDRVGQGSFEDADSRNDIIRGGGGADVLLGGWGYDRLYGKSGSDELHDLECTKTRLGGGAGSDYFESWTSSLEGYGGNLCSEAIDRIIGGSGADAAKVNKQDSVSHVERVMRVTEIP